MATRPSYQTTAAPLYTGVANPSVITQPSSLNQTYNLTSSGGYAPSVSTIPTTHSTVPLSGYNGSSLPLGTTLSQGPILPQSTFQSAPLSSAPLSAPTSTFSQGPVLQQGLQSQLPGQQLPLGQQAGGTQLPNAELELKKRMLDKHRDLKMKEAEMETNKEKKLEEKAEKQREKAVKWISRGIAPGMANRHETKADKLELQAHEHHMKAEQYKLEAKQLEAERKSFDPPKEEKKAPARPGQTGAKTASRTTNAVGDKKIETTTVEKKEHPASTATSQPSLEKKIEQTQHTVPQTGSSTA